MQLQTGVLNNSKRKFFKKKVVAIMLSILISLAITSPTLAIRSIPVNGINLSSNKISLEAGETYNLKVSFTPKNTSQRFLKYVIENKNIATIDKDGKITATTPGTTAITVISSSDNKISVKCNIIVSEMSMMNISIALWNLSDFGNDAIGRKIANDMRIKLTVMPMDWGNYAEQKQLWAASNNLPDIIATYTVDDDITRFYGWQESGLTRTIPEALINKYPTVKALFADNDIEKMVKNVKGEYYAIPRPISLKNMYKFDQGVGFYYRKDWLGNVGIKNEPKTIDEFYEMLKKFTFDDPDKNGKNDTFGMTSTKAPYMTFCWWGVNPETWVREDGKWIPGYASKKIIPALKFWNKIYKEKLIDSEFATNNRNQNIQKFCQGTFGVSVCNVDDRWIYKFAMENFSKAQGMEKLEADKILEKVGVLGPIKGDEKNIVVWPRIMDTSGTEISAKVDDKKLDRIMALFEYLSRPDILTMNRYGFEGKEYIKKDGKILPLVNPKTGLVYNIGSIYPSSIINLLPSWDFDNDTISPSIPKQIKDLAQKVREEFNPIAAKDNFSVRFMTTPAKDATYVDLSEAFTTLMMTNGDVEQAYNKWLMEQMNRGISKAIEEVNAKVKELGI